MSSPTPDTRAVDGRSVARAQTTIDYTVGVTLFLVVTAFVFAFVPTMFDPFAGEEGESLVADRAATQLSSDLLSDPATPYALDADCVRDFFEETGDDGIPTDCGYDTRSLADAVGADATVSLNATVERDGVVSYAAGPPTSGGSVVTAQRFVTIDGRAYRLYVRVW